MVKQPTQTEDKNNEEEKKKKKKKKKSEMKNSPILRTEEAQDERVSEGESEKGRADLKLEETNE